MPLFFPNGSRTLDLVSGRIQAHGTISLKNPISTNFKTPLQCCWRAPDTLDILSPTSSHCLSICQTSYLICLTDGWSSVSMFKTQTDWVFREGRKFRIECCSYPTWKPGSSWPDRIRFWLITLQLDGRLSLTILSRKGIFWELFGSWFQFF